MVSPKTPVPISPAPPTTGSDDPRCIPYKLDTPLPIGQECAYPEYTDEEQAVWRCLIEQQQTLLPERAASEFLTGLASLGLDCLRIPKLSEVSEKLRLATGWQLARSPGLLDAHDFFGYLAQRVFPCTDYVRGRAELDYTPAPDCFHDIFGHTPMIMHPRFADFYQKIGQAALACKDPVIEEGLTRIYWFTVEFGLIKNPAGLRIFGNGIISSYGETLHSLTDEVEKQPMLPEKVAAQPYDIWHFQETLFVVESFDQLELDFTRWAKHHQLL